MNYSNSFYCRFTESRTTYPKPLFESRIENVLLVAGSLDGDGAVASGMKRLAEAWNAKRDVRRPVSFAEIQGAGHLPMIDETERFAEVLTKFLSRLCVTKNLKYCGEKNDH